MDSQVENAIEIAFNPATDQALKGFNDSLTTYRALGDKRGVAHATFSIGRLQEQRGDDNQALKHYREALQGYRTIGAKSEEALTMNNICLRIRRYRQRAAVGWRSTNAAHNKT